MRPLTIQPYLNQPFPALPQLSRFLTPDVYNRYCQPSFDDSNWRVIDVPHDFVVEGSFTRSADQAHGYLPFGVGWYRKHMDLPAQDADAVYELTFDGVQVQSARSVAFSRNNACSR